MSQRITEVNDVPFPAGVEILHPERVILRFKHGISFDIGALCYLIRDTSSTNRKKQTFSSESLSNNRIEQVRKLIKQISEQTKLSGNRSATLEAKYRYFKRFIDWCDGHSYFAALNDKHESMSALNEYSDNLIDEIGRGILSNNSAANHQTAVASILNEFHNVEDLTRGLRRIKKDSGQTQNTLVPSETSQSPLLAWSEALFGGMSKLVLKNLPYPFAIDLPDSIKCFNKKMWVFPIERMSENIIDNKDRFSVRDYSSGQLYTVYELYQKRIDRANNTKDLRALCIDVVSKAKRDISINNNSLYTPIRINHACLGLSAFFLLFLANTGMNLAQAIDLDWNKDAELATKNPTVSRQGFRGIKYRAQGRDVFFEIGVKFFQKFKEYLELRKYLLNGKELPKLFFYNYGSKGIIKLDIQVLEKYFKRLIRLDPQLQKIRARQWRAAKQDFAISKLSPHEAAELMQHKLSTAMSSYSNGTESTHLREMGAYLGQVGKMVVARDMRFLRGQDNSLGLCADFDKPKALNKNILVLPDCKSPEGCLFCDKYRIHADEKDARKLFSCRHCVRATSSLSANQDEYLKTFGEILARIEFVIGELRDKDSDMVSRIEFEVDENGELDPYWAIKYEKLMEFGLI